MLLEGQQQNELVWNELTPVSITSPSYTIINWYAQTPGTYMWAVKAVYSDGILSPAAFSNTITIPPIERGIISGFAGITPTQPVNGAIINAGIYTTTSDATGHFSMEVPIGTYTVACTFPDNMQLINYNVVVQEAHTTYCWFVIFVQNANEIQILQTKLQSNYPNPFNPETTICYDLKDNSPVRIDIFNTRGQHVKTLVNEAKAAGSYEVVWNGKDTNGKDVASGIYHYRMQAGSYSESHRMMLLK